MFALNQEFSAPHTTPPEKLPGDCKELEADRARTGGPHWLKGYSVLHGVVLT